MQIPYLSFLDSEHLPETSRLLNKTDFHRLACNNWSRQFPYTPRVVFTMAHNGAMLFIKFKVKETVSRACVCEDNGEIWTDSCVELFLSLDDSGYYNFEFSCIGKMLLGFHKDRPTAVHAPADVLNSILRYPSLGEGNFEETSLTHPWELTLAIPPTALFRHTLHSWAGVQARINLYKCGNKLSLPHYLSWRPIDTPKPDFHVPRCFVGVQFQ